MRKIKTNLKFYRSSAGKTFRTQNDTDSANFWYTVNKKYRLYQVRNVFFVRRTAKVCIVGIVLRTESWFSLITAVKCCVQIIWINLKFYHTSAGKTFRTQNDTDSANFWYTANKKYRSYHVRNVYFVRRTAKVNIVGIVLRTESSFSRTSAGKC